MPLASAQVMMPLVLMQLVDQAWKHHARVPLQIRCLMGRAHDVAKLEIHVPKQSAQCCVCRHLCFRHEHGLDLELPCTPCTHDVAELEIPVSSLDHAE